jgi:hypothetical protein
MDIVIFEPLVKRLQGLDEALEHIEEAFPCADPLGLLDDAETIAGEGFLACQLYMIERKGEWPGANAYACGPRHNAQYLAQIINTAGNYRKHRGEWPMDPARWGADQHRAVAVFQGAGVVEPEFWLWNLLIQLTKPGRPRFGALVPRLIAWRDAFDQLPPIAISANRN